MFRFARFLGASEGRAAGVALILGLATIAFPYATELTGEPVAAVCVFTAFYCWRRSTSIRRRRARCAAGFLAGWAVLNDYPVFLVAAAIGIYSLFKLPELKFLAAFSAGAAITVVVMLGVQLGRIRKSALFQLPGVQGSPDRESSISRAGGRLRRPDLSEDADFVEHAARSAARIVLLQPGAAAVDRRRRIFRADRNDGAPNLSSPFIRSSC